MTSKSKSKGNKLERDVRDVLNTMYDTEEFARTPGSGALMGQSNFRKNSGLEDMTKRTLGSDLICPEWFPASIECKNYADKPNYSTIIKSDDKTLNGWLGETIFDAINFGLVPMLVFRTNRQGTHVVLPEMMLDVLDVTHYVKYNEFVIIGIQHFEQQPTTIRLYFQTHQDKILEWMNTSPYVTTLLEQLQLALAKKKKKDISQIDAMQHVLDERK
jgi:hypothetical protein